MNCGELRGVSVAVKNKRDEVPAERALLVGISGIDASGKGYIAAKAIRKLSGLNVALINADGLLNLPDVRFDPADPAENFYKNALRLDEMFERLVLPLKTNRNIDVTMDYPEETATEFSPHRYRFEKTDIVVLEGIFLFKRQYANHFDLKIWIECSFDTSLSRAVDRAQEGLSVLETEQAYKTIYFPAQRIHSERDDPVEAADIVFVND